VHWGLALNESLGLVFVPISDKKIFGFPSPGEPAPGLYALDIETGSLRWKYARESRCADASCVFGLSAAIIAANDIVVAGSMDGFLDVIAATSGELLWSFDSWNEYSTVNGVEAVGGAFDAHGPMVADDLLIVTSGYGYVGQQRRDNALLVFQVGRGDE
jgi:polyvinyl alcohol dehydrogenase (cytochrome)